MVFYRLVTYETQLSTFKRILVKRILAKPNCRHYSHIRPFLCKRYLFSKERISVSIVTCTLHTHTEHSVPKILRQFDQLNADQRTYLERIRKDYQAALDSSFAKHNQAAERFVGKFVNLNNAYNSYSGTLQDIIDCHSLLNEHGMQDLAKSEINSLTVQLKDLYNAIQSEITQTLQPTKGDVLLEVHMATGGIESSIFARDLKNMYENLAMNLGYSWRVIEEDLRGVDSGLARIEVEICGADVFGTFQFEAGVHRVQRVPVNDTRIHTSTAVVLVVMKPDDIKIKINPDDLEIVYTTAQGPGGAFVNSTKSKCHMKHKPSGFATSCQVSRVAERNRIECVRKLEAMLLHEQLGHRDSDLDSKKKQQALQGDRSDKMRTYNYRADRITDHRHKVSISGIVDYFSNPSKFLEFHETVSRCWQLGKLSELANELSDQGKKSRQ